MPLLWDVTASRPKRFRRVLRCPLVLIPPSETKSQRRRLVAQVSADPPGFSDTVTHFAATQACVISVLSDPAAVDPNYLTAYRYCALLEFDDCKSSGHRLTRQSALPSALRSPCQRGRQCAFIQDVHGCLSKAIAVSQRHVRSALGAANHIL